MLTRFFILVGAAVGIGLVAAVTARTGNRERSNVDSTITQESTNMTPSNPAPKGATPMDCPLPAADWKSKLTPEQFHVTQEKGTERAFSGEHWNNHRAGMYHCVVCGKPLFSSETKFESGTGWPSFYQAVDDETIAKHADNSHFMQRTEATCSHCGAHLGHVFDDGPNPTGLRYCINSAALQFNESANQQPNAKRIAPQQAE